MKQRLVEAAPALERRPLRLSILPSELAGRRDLVGAMRLADGSFVTFRVSPYIASPPGLAITTAAHLALTGLVLLIALLMIRALIRPLGELADAADATHPGQPATVRIQGPNEVRRVATAFAAMQTRLLHMVEDHTQSLIAVSHDLRTPIQRLRLRTALLDDSDPRDAMTGDLIDNATRHANRIEVALAFDGQNYVIAVDDDGAGIPPHRRAEAVLPFRRLEDARGCTSGGAGLGLATSSKAASALGGTLFLQDGRLGGLCAGVTLPIR